MTTHPVRWQAPQPLWTRFSANGAAAALSPEQARPTLLRFALPNMLAMVATALAAIAETAYVGSFGVGSLAGMALVFPMVMLQSMLSAGAMGGGVSSAVSRAFGAGDPARGSALAVHAMWIGVAAGSVYMLVMLAFGPALFAKWGSIHSKSRPVEIELPCRPCLRNYLGEVPSTCSRGDVACLARITPVDVLAEVQQVLAADTVGAAAAP